MNNDNLKLHYNGTQKNLNITNKSDGSIFSLLPTDYAWENDILDKIYNALMEERNSIQQGDLNFLDFESKIEIINIIHSAEIIFHMDLIKNSKNLNVSSKYPLIFVHIPKTAGQSVNNVLGIDESREGHRDLRQLQYSLDLNVYNNNKKFGIIRNPFEKIISLYSYRISNKHKWSIPSIYYETIKNATFEQWFWNFHVHINMLTSPHLQFKSCYDCLVDDTGKLGVDYTLRFENLEEDWNNMFGELNIEAPLLPKINKSKHKHYSEYFNCSTGEQIKDFIYQKFKNDFKYFGYKFENKA